MPTVQITGSKPLVEKEELKAPDGDFELISLIRSFAGLKYDVNGEHGYTRQRGNHDLSVPLPARRLFYDSYSLDTESSHSVRDDEVDIDTVDEEEPLVETRVANRLLNECEKLIEIYRPRPVDKEVDDNWDEIIPKSNWSSSQLRAFTQLLKILNYDRLSLLSYSSHSSEAIVRRTTIELTACRLRTLFTKHSWNNKLCQWLHGIVVDRAPNFVLLSYLEAMQVLYNRIPSLINQVINSSSVSLSSKNLGLDIITQIITKKFWDPVAPMLSQHKMPKLPVAPIFIVLGSEPLHDLPSNSRTHHWISLLTELGTVIPITSLQTDRDKSRMKIASYLDELLYTVRFRIQSARSEFSDSSKRPIILFGINAGGPLMCHAALFETNNVQGVVCVGFSVDTAEGKRGEPKDRLLELTCPTLFVIGQCASTSSEYDMEQIRKRLKCISGLIVVGGADDQLRKQKLDLMQKKITQDIVDRAVVIEIAAFLSKALTMPKPTMVPKVVTIPAIVTPGADGITILKTKETKLAKKEKDGKAKKNYYQEKKRRLAEMLAMGVTASESPTKKQKRELPDKNPKILMVSAAPTILRTPASSTLARNKNISPRKSLDDASGGGVPQITIVTKPIPSSQVQNSHTKTIREGSFPVKTSHGEVSVTKYLGITPSVKLPASTTIQPAVAKFSTTVIPVSNPAKVVPASATSSETAGSLASVTSLQSLLKSHQSAKPVPPQVKKKPVANTQPTLTKISSSSSVATANNIRVIKASDKSRTFNVTSLSNVRYITSTSTASAQLSNVNTLIPISSLTSGGQIRTIKVRPTMVRPTSASVKVKPSLSETPTKVVTTANLLRDLRPIDILDAPIDMLDEPMELMEEDLVEEIETEPLSSSLVALNSPNVKLIRINKSGVNISSAANCRVVYK